MIRRWRWFVAGVVVSEVVAIVFDVWRIVPAYARSNMRVKLAMARRIADYMTGD